MKSLSPLAFPIYKLCIYFKLSPSGTCVSFLWMVTDFFIRKNKFDLLVKTNTYILIVNKYVTEGEKISDQTRI